MKQTKGHQATLDTERLQTISDMRDNGTTLQEIADTFGITRQRVHQILNAKYAHGKG
jgi:DNA-directed RNA polymerase sigma subunit (sigma70/sigma32)